MYICVSVIVYMYVLTYICTVLYDVICVSDIKNVCVCDMCVCVCVVQMLKSVRRCC